MKRPSFTLNIGASLIATVLVPSIPEETLSFKWKFIIIGLVYLISFIIYEFRLRRYFKETEFQYASVIKERDDCLKTLNDQLVKHDKLKVRYRVIGNLIKRHENIASRFIDMTMISLNIPSNNKDIKDTYEASIKLFCEIKKDELGKYNDGKDEYYEENTCD